MSIIKFPEVTHSDRALVHSIIESFSRGKCDRNTMMKQLSYIMEQKRIRKMPIIYEKEVNQMIKSHIEAIQREIKERFGVEANIKIVVYGTISNMCMDEAVNIVAELQPDFEDEVKPDNHNGSYWVSVGRPFEGSELTVFYCGGN